MFKAKGIVADDGPDVHWFRERGDLVRLKPGLPGSTILVSARGTYNHAASRACLGAERQKRLNFINHVTREGESALHRAVYSKNLAAVQVLLEAGADCGLLSDDHHTPYTYALLFSRRRGLRPGRREEFD